MTPGAVICDVYGTLLDVGPRPTNADLLWEQLWREHLGSTPRLALAALSANTTSRIDTEHARARATGIAHPEIDWSAILVEALPELGALDGASLDEFIRHHMSLSRTLRLMPGAAPALRALRERGVRLGIASNAQAYTLSELEDLLHPEHLGLSTFDPELRFWSFEHGYSKPDPRAFRWLALRLGRMGVSPEATLMVGDRPDNDLAPAALQGWRTWHLRTDGTGPGAGSWSNLTEQLGLAAGPTSLSAS